MSQKYSEAVQLMYSTFKTPDLNFRCHIYNESCIQLGIFDYFRNTCKNVRLIEHFPQLGDAEMYPHL